MEYPNDTPNFTQSYKVAGFHIVYNFYTSNNNNYLQRYVNDIREGGERCLETKRSGLVLGERVGEGTRRQKETVTKRALYDGRDSTEAPVIPVPVRLRVVEINLTICR